MGIKLRIKLANGVEIKKKLNDKQLQKLEKDKIYKKIDRYNNKTFNCYQKSDIRYLSKITFNRDNIIKERLQDLQLYISKINNI